MRRGNENYGETLMNIKIPDRFDIKNDKTLSRNICTH
jgi:hypothetical protein